MKETTIQPTPDTFNIGVQLAEVMANQKNSDENLRSTLQHIVETKSMVNEANNQNNSSKNYQHENLTKIFKEIENIKASSSNLPSIQENLNNISSIFTNSKNRGNVGEAIMEDIIKNSFGVNNENINFQYSLKDGSIVDVAIFHGENIIAVDSKFPLDNYKKMLEVKNSNEVDKYLKNFKADVKTKVTECKKYVSSKDKIEFVILFIPSDAIFFDIQEKAMEVIEYGAKNSITFASPTTLIAMIAVFLNNQKNEQRIKNIDKNMESLEMLIEQFAAGQKE
jgi:DNA recombination protein RmuC